MVSFRQGYGSNPRSKSAGVPPAALRWLQAAQQQAPVQQQQQPEGAEGPADAVVSAALGMLRPAVAASGWQLTRLAVSFSYEEGGGGAQQAPGQLALTACAQWGGTSKQAAAAASAEAPTEPAAAQAGAATAPAACQPAPATCAQQDSMPPQQQPPKPPAQPQRPAAKPASYRNAEALAMLQLFGGSGSGAPAGLAPADADLAPEERASLELALRLQQEEAQAAAEPAAAGGKRSAAGGAGGGKPPKQQRRGSGPMDAFLKRSGAR